MQTLTVTRSLLGLLPLLSLACSAEVTGPTPAVASLDPSLVCGEQIEKIVTLTGSGLSPLAIDAATGDPRLAIPDVSLRRTADLAGNATSDTAVNLPNDPYDPSSARVRWTSEMSMEFDVYPELNLAPGIYEVTVTNKNGKSFSQLSALTVVGRPMLDAVVPDLVCVEQGARAVTLEGSGFVSIGTALPTVSVGGVVLPVDSLSGCVDLPGPTAAQICTSAALTLPGTLALGAPAIVLQNPESAECVTEENVTMAIVPTPTLASVQPDLFCVEEGVTTLTLTGTGFVRADTDLPTVWFGTTPITATALSGCTSIAGTLIDAASCTTLTVDVPTASLTAGPHDVSVENPMPAGCTSTETVTVEVAAAPVIAAIVPAAICSINQPAQMTIQGTGFLDVGGTLPTVTVDGAPVNVVAMANCTALTGTQLTAQVCTEITFDVPGGGFASGAHSVVVTNPAPADCQNPAAGRFDITSAPTVTSVVPFKVCTDGGTFAVNGTNFVPGSQIQVNGTNVATAFVSDTQLTGTIANGIFAAGIYDVTVSNGVGCEDTLTTSINLVDAPIVFFVDPPQVYNGIDLQVTIYASGITDDIVSVGIRLTGTTNPLTVLAFTYNPARPNRVLAVVPIGTPAGDYDVFIQDVACGAMLENSLHVTDTLTVDVASIEPPFGYIGENTGVILTSTEPPPTGFENFEVTPRVYLNPTAGGLATELRAVAFDSAGKLTGVVPAGLVAGMYDVVIINPDGHVGLLPAAYEALVDAVPVITELVPGLVENQSDQSVDVLGLNFRGPVTVGATCRKPGDPDTVHTAVVGTTTATSITTTWDFSALNGGQVCVVRVTNADGSYADFSALSVTNPANNLNDLTLSSDMVVGRRALAGAALRMNAVSRFVFAIGGDDGVIGSLTRHSSVEAAPIGPFGDIGTWTLQRNSLPAGRNFTAASTIGRYVYIGGGSIAGVPTPSVLRAYLLDPFEAPVVDDLDLARNEVSGLDGGIWYYRVSAVMASGDANNPSGESLASEPLVVQLPSFTDKIQLTIYWTRITGATDYRIYRSPTPDLTSGSEELLAVIPQGTSCSGSRCNFLDDGSLTTTPGATPLPLGSLGVWHEVGPMATAREGAAVVAVADPNLSDTHYLYVIGGRDDLGVARDDYEYAVINATAPNVQTVGAFTVGANTLPNGRWQAGAVYIDAARVPSTPATDAWIYVLPGVASDGTTEVNEVTALPIDTVEGNGADDGSLGVAVAVDALLFGGGYGYVAGNGFLHVLGGQGATPSAGARTAEVCGVGVAGCGVAITPPDLGNWNAGVSLVLERFLHATANESGFIFLLGGQTIADGASTTTERTNF